MFFKSLILPALFLFAPWFVRGQHCAADLIPRDAETTRQLELETARWILENGYNLQNREVITIPVVVHVVYRTAPQNISQEQIESQFAVLNADYRSQNDNQDLIPPIFQGLIADTELEFCLATVDPAGNPTTGITRTLTTKDDIGISTDVHHAALGGANSWDPVHYLNIWVADMGENTVGRATFPGAVPADEDGVVVDPRYFGTTGLAAGSFPYNEGRTTVHEIGHYLNLHHPWGSGVPSCDGNDFVEDTPLTSENYLGECPQTLQASCGSLDMFTNFMYYTDDACMAQFTPGQKLRMLACLNGPRAGLLDSPGCQPVNLPPDPSLAFSFSISPNPGAGYTVFECMGNSPDHCRLSIFDMTGRLIEMLEIPANQPYSWLAPAGLPDGVYIVRAAQGDKNLARKLALTR